MLSEAGRPGSPTPRPLSGDPLHDQLTSGLGTPSPSPTACSVDIRHRAQTSFLLPRGVACCLAFCFIIKEDIFNKIGLPCGWMLWPFPVTLTESQSREFSSLISDTKLPESGTEQNRPREDIGHEG